MWSTNQPSPINWEYGPPIYATVKRRSRRRNRARRCTPLQITTTTDQVGDSGVEYVIQDEWSLKAVHNNEVIQHVDTISNKQNEQNVESSDATRWSTAVCTSDIPGSDFDEPTTVWSSVFDESSLCWSSTDHGMGNSLLDIVHKPSDSQVVGVDEVNVCWSTATDASNEGSDVEEGCNSWSTTVDGKSSYSSDDVSDTSSSVIGVCWSTLVDDDVSIEDKPSASSMKTVQDDAMGCSIYSTFERLPINQNILKDYTSISISECSSEQNEFIDMVIDRIFEKLQLTEEYMRMIYDYCAKLERNLQVAYGDDCRLTMFGSIVNGFGVIGSDVDISFRFGSDKPPEDSNSGEVIVKLAEVLSQIAGIVNVYAIPNAKVPIVKFEYEDALYHFESDLSLYNALALENTRLLREYSDIDKRVKRLGTMLKKWSSYCGIRDASCGKLSSYALIVMLIHFLQRTTPPVLPFLQQAQRYLQPKKHRIIDGCDVYFCKAAEIGWKVKNTESTSQLWLRFLAYYAKHFDFESMVVQIRMSKPVNKLQKGWSWKPIAIEDPFDLDHNLSNGVHWDTFSYIKDSFLRSHKRFASLQYSKQSVLGSDLHDFLADVFSGCRPVDDKQLNPSGLVPLRKWYSFNRHITINHMLPSNTNSKGVISWNNVISNTSEIDIGCIKDDMNQQSNEWSCGDDTFNSIVSG